MVYIGGEEIPRGFKFNPSKLQLFEFYLIPKVLGQNMDFCSWFVFEKDLYNGYSNPMVLFDEINRHYDTKHFGDDHKKGEQIRYFFTPIIRVSKTGKNVRRTTKDGKWDGDCSEAINLPGTDTPIGIKRYLKFQWNESIDSEYARRGKQSSWIMHEFSLHQSFYDSRGMKETYVLCSIRRTGGALADDQVIQQPPPLIDAEVARKRQRMIHDQPIVEPVAAIKDASSLALEDVTDEEPVATSKDASASLAPEGVLLSTDDQQDDDLPTFSSFLDILPSDDDDIQQQEDSLAQQDIFLSTNEAMNACKPVPASTTILSPSLDAILTQQPYYVNGPYMSSPPVLSCAPPPSIIDIDSLLEAPLIEVSSSTEANLWDNNRHNLAKEFNYDELMKDDDLPTFSSFLDIPLSNDDFQQQEDNFALDEILPYMSSPAVLPPPTIITPDVTPQTSYINLQSSPSITMETPIPSPFMMDLDIDSLLESPSTEISEEVNLWGYNSYSMKAEINRRSNTGDIFEDMLIGMV